MAGKTKVHEEQIEQSRSWIFEAFIRLLDEKPYSKISVSDITKKAGVARQTFYRHYETKDDVILQFLEICFNPNPIEIKDIHRENKRDTLMMTLPLNKFVRHAKALKKILTSDVEYLVFMYTKKWTDYLINLYDERLSGDDKIWFRYMVQFTNIGFTQVLCDWIKNDMPISVEKLSAWLAKINFYHDSTNANIPRIILKVKT